MRGTQSNGGNLGTISRRTILSHSIGLGAASMVGLIGSVGSVSAQETTAGQGIWQFDMGDFVVSSPTIVGTTLYMGSNGGTVCAIDANTGGVEWRFTDPNEPVRSSPNVVDGTVYIGDDSGTLYAITADSGEREWSRNVGINSTNSPVVTEGVVYVGGQSEGVYALDAASGDENWHFELDFIAQASPVVADGTVYIGSAIGSGPPSRVYAIDAASGTEEWVSELPSSGGSVETSPALGDGLLYVGEQVGDRENDPVYHLRAIDIESGETEWMFETNGRPHGTPTVANGTVYIGTVVEIEPEASEFQGTLHAIDTASGDEQWRFENEETNIASSPTVAGGTVYFGSDGVYAADTETGTVQWQFGEPAIARSSPTVVDGVVFVGLDDQSVYAIDAGIDGSSEDSRVLQGVLGHHHGWAGEEPQTLEPVVSYTPGGGGGGGSSSGPVGTVFQRFSGPAGSPLFLGAAGVLGTATAYLGYRLLNGDDEHTTAEETADSNVDELEQTVRGNASEYPSISTYEEFERRERIMDLPTARVHMAQLNGKPFWVLEPAASGETVDTDAMEAFNATIQPWTQMDHHPNLLHVLGSGEHPFPWVAFEPADYPPAIETTADTPLAGMVEIAVETCEALHHIYRYGAQYHNLTTESVVVTDADTVLLRSIIDQFDTADPWYHAPEEFTNDPTEQSSIYRVGLILYELLTGTLPYQAFPDGDPQTVIQRSNVVPPSERIDGLSEQVDQVLRRSLAKDPADRFETILHFRDGLSRMYGKL